MIKFFRKIRQKLLSENKFGKYLIYALGEIILVVIGILIPLQINDWNAQNKKENLLPPMSGKPGEVVLVMDDALFKGAVGDTIFNLLCQQELALPQTGFEGAEPMFDLVQVPREAFSNIFNFASNIDKTRIVDATLDRFCNSILPRINTNVKSLIVESPSLERILLTTDYSNLTELKLVYFQRDSTSRYFAG